MEIYNLNSLKELESEAIYIIREAAAQFERLALLFSGGKDSIVLLNIAKKAFWPAKIPFPLLHIDTGHNFEETLRFRDHIVASSGFNLIIREVQDSINKGKVVEEKGLNASRNSLQTITLLDSIEEFKFDALFGGGRRDEEKARAKERFFSHRDEFGQWNPKNQRPELWNIYNGRKKLREHFRVFPLSNWTELDIWRYIEAEGLEVPSIYFSHCRKCIIRDETILAFSQYLSLKQGEIPQNMQIRFRTVGDMTCTGALLSNAKDVKSIINEISFLNIGERGARFDDKRSDSSMEDRKKRGVFLMASELANIPLRDAGKIELLKLGTVGSVDDGKSTLIGRLLYDGKLILKDQLEAIERITKQRGEETLNLSLLVDGLRAEREQGITIDVAYRYFSTAKRKFIIADTPGHVQYTRNMATGASNCSLAILLIDARNGIVEQTKRHSFIVSLLQIPHIVLCINKMDLVGYNKEIFEKIVEEYKIFASRLNIKDISFIPISALKGDNVVNKSLNMKWYEGVTLMHLLENIYIASDYNLRDCRFPVQGVIRSNSFKYPDHRAYTGRIAGGIFKPGDEVKILPSGFTSKITSIFDYDKTMKEAFPPMSVSMLLKDDIDISRGDMIVRANNLPNAGQDIDLMVCWMNEKKLINGGKYIVKHTTKETKCIIKEIFYKIDINTLHRLEDNKDIGMNDIGRIQIRTTSPLFYDSYTKNRITGSLIFIDEATNETVGAGMIR